MTSLLTAGAATLALVSWFTSVRAEAPGGCAKVEVQNLRVGQGPLLLAAYGDAVSFRKTALSQLQQTVSAQVMAVQLCGLTGAVVAITAFQDLNSNGKLDSNLVGMPTEPWGASGAPATLGPTWESARVPLGAEAITVKLSK